MRMLPLLLCALTSTAAAAPLPAIGPAPALRAAAPDELAALIEEGQTAGCFDVEDARLAAHFVLAMFADLLYEAIAFRKPTSGKRTLAFSSRFMLRALGVAPDRAHELVPSKGASS